MNSAETRFIVVESQTKVRSHIGETPNKNPIQYNDSRMSSILFNVVKLMPEDVPGSTLPAEPEDCNCDALRRWLKTRGLKQSGLRKEIVNRVKLSIPLNLDIILHCLYVLFFYL